MPPWFETRKNLIFKKIKNSHFLLFTIFMNLFLLNELLLIISIEWLTNELPPINLRLSSNLIGVSKAPQPPFDKRNSFYK